MQRFFRLLRPALRQRWTLAGILFSSLMVALLWGLNIGALFPVLRVALNDQPLQSWIAEEIHDAQADIVANQTELWAMAETPENRRARRRLQSEIATDRDAVQFYRRAAGLAAYLPRDPFQTIVAIVLMLVLGTALKGAFVFCNLMLVARLSQNYG